MTEPVIYGVDHVCVPLTHAEAAYGVLTETLGLPIAWPYSAHGNVASGGVNLGNLNLEVLGQADALGFNAHVSARVRGIALRPVGTSSRLLAEFEDRRVAHSPPATFPPRASASTGAMWTNVMLEHLSSPATTVFTCEYQFPGPHDYDSRQAYLDGCGGGTLGVTGVSEIVISSPRPPAAIDRWQQLLDPVSPNGPGYWRIAHEPALRIISGPADTVEQVVVGVRSLAAMKQAGNDLIQALHRLDIRFVETESR